MNYFQKKAQKNLKRFIEDDIDTILIIPNKRNKLYKRQDGRLISHRAVAKVIRGLMKKRNK